MIILYACTGQQSRFPLLFFAIQPPVNRGHLFIIFFFFISIKVLDAACTSVELLVCGTKNIIWFICVKAVRRWLPRRYTCLYATWPRPNNNNNANNEWPNTVVRYRVIRFYVCNARRFEKYYICLLFFSKRVQIGFSNETGIDWRDWIFGRVDGKGKPTKAGAGQRTSGWCGLGREKIRGERMARIRFGGRSVTRESIVRQASILQQAITKLF